MATGTWHFSKQNPGPKNRRGTQNERETNCRKEVGKQEARELDFIVSERVPTASFCFKSLRLVNITFQVLTKAEQAFSLI